MRSAKEFIGKPIYSLTDGQHLGTVKDLYLDLALETVKGIFLGHEGLFSRRARFIPREQISVFGIDAVLVNGSDVVTDSDKMPVVEDWQRREELQGRDVDTPGGTKVGALGDVLLDESANIVGFSLARVYVEGPVNEKRTIMKNAVIDVGGDVDAMTVNLAAAEGAEAIEPAEAVLMEVPSEESAPAEDVPEINEEVEPLKTEEESE